MKIALLQTNPQDNLKNNVSQIMEMSLVALAKGAELLVYPEVFTYMGADGERQKHADTVSPPSGVFAQLSEFAKHRNCYLIAGSHAEKSNVPGKVFNTGVAFQKNGEVIASYRKKHLFNLKDAQGNPLYCESDSLTPGNENCFFQVNEFYCQYAICYDLRFPEFFRRTQKNEQAPDIIFFPAAFTHQTGKDHWEVLLRARAIENQCYVVGCNQTGFHSQGKKRNWGHSLVVDPWGNVVASLDEEISTLHVEIKKDAILEARTRLPALADRIF
jgi:deaminated glutathione amidase